MKTLRELKKIFIGEIIAVMMVLPFAVVLNGDVGMSFMYIVEEYIMDGDSWFKLLQYGCFTLMMTYVIYTLYRAIERDVQEVIQHFRKEKKATN